MAATGYVSTSGDARKVNRAGDTMTGDLVLNDDTPDTGNSASPRAYVDGKLSKTANLSDLQDPVEARTNLGLGDSATRPQGQQRCCERLPSRTGGEGSDAAGWR